jgi:hypothetical protein
VYVKPGNGTGGHSVMKIKRQKDTFLLQGRRRSGRLLKAKLHSKRAVAVMLDRWVESEKIRSGRFMVQQGLNLQLLPDRLVDVRLLIQKNGSGKWEVTGKVLRAGGKDSPTTNLIYGDGKAIRYHAFLESRFGRQKAKEIDEECNLLAVRLVEVVEKKFGSMIEFGLDIGIDVDGFVWLIEVNPKPSHDAFLKSNERDIYLTSVLRPIQYAVYLAKKQKNEEVESD